MKKIVFILLAMWMLIPASKAAHILGGVISYEHISDLKYKVWVTIYRDCSECLLDGRGGGNSTKNCGEFELSVQRSDRYSCGASFLDNYSLTFSGITKIVPVCKGVTTSCDTGKADYNIGVESHKYYAIVDFDRFSSSSSCGFDLYVRMFDRAGDIDNLTGVNNNYFNYAFINPSLTHDSPEFSSNPLMVIPVNQPVRVKVGSSGQTEDSVVYKLSEPLKDYKKAISYASGFTVNKPLSVYCNGSSACSADRTANPPIGYSFNEKDGSLVFTPTQNSEKAVLVFEAYVYRKSGSTFQLISIVRQDIQVITVFQGNNVPVLEQTKTDIHLCAGNKWVQEFTAIDKPFSFPDGTTGKQHTVHYDWESGIKNLNGNVQSIDSAPYNKLTLTWTPSESDARDYPYLVKIKVEDDHCPLKGFSEYTYSVYVHPSKAADVDIKKLWCGNLESNYIELGDEKVDSVHWSWERSSGELLQQKWNVNRDTFLPNVSNSQVYLNYFIRSSFGCGYQGLDSVFISGSDLNGFNLSVDTNVAFCLNDIARIDLKTQSASNIESIKWFDGVIQVSSGYSYSFPINSVTPFPAGLSVVASGSKGFLQCRSAIEINPKVSKGPAITLASEEYADCNIVDIELSDFASPKDGSWTSINHQNLNGSLLEIGQVDREFPHDFCQEYKLIDKLSGCATKDTFCVRLHPIPVVQMKPATICNFNGLFNLANLIERPFGLEPYQVKFIIDGQEGLYEEKDGKFLIDLDLLADGEHLVKGIITNSDGCSNSDSSILNLTQSLEITAQSVISICQEDDVPLSELFKIKPIGGMWTSPANYDAVTFDNTIAEDFCGDVDLVYTYDQYGCYAQEVLKLKVICKPSLIFDIPDEVCSNSEPITLKSTSSDGYFEGDNVVGNELTIGDLRGETEVRYLVDDGGCSFIYRHLIKIIPVPRYRVATVPSLICDEDNLEIQDIRIEQGKLSLTVESRQVLYEAGNYPSEIFPITEAQRKKGYVDLEIDVYGNGACPNTREVRRIIIDKPLKFTPKDTLYEGCSPFNWQPVVDIQGNSVGADVNWNFGDPQSGSNNTSKSLTPEHIFEIPGLYTVSYETETAAGCKANNSWEDLVWVKPSPIAGFTMNPNEPVSYRLPLVKFTSTSRGLAELKHAWNFGTFSNRDTSSEKSPQFFFIGDTATYEVTLMVTDTNGCSDKVTRNVIVGEDITLYIPNAFTPNKIGPEVNEAFHIIGLKVSSFKIEIVNRWGEVVYFSENINESWDGYYLNKLCIGGIYAYRINVISETGAEYDYTGTINLIR